MYKNRVLSIALTVIVCLCGVWPVFAHLSSSWAARDYGGTMWKLEGKRIYTGESGGHWSIGIRAMAEGESGDSISMSSSKSVSNSVSGNVGIPLKKLNTSFQFNVSRQWSASASKSYGLSDKKKGSWWAIKYKRVFKNYKIRARQYAFYDGTWHKTRKKKWVRAKRFNHFAYKLSPSTAPKNLLPLESGNMEHVFKKNDKRETARILRGYAYAGRTGLSASEGSE